MKYQVRKVIGYTDEGKPIQGPSIGVVRDSKQKAEHDAFKLKQIHPKDEYLVLPVN